MTVGIINQGFINPTTRIIPSRVKPICKKIIHISKTRNTVLIKAMTGLKEVHTLKTFFLKPFKISTSKTDSKPISYTFLRT